MIFMLAVCFSSVQPLLIGDCILYSSHNNFHKNKRVKIDERQKKEERVGMTVSDCAVRSFHGKQGGQADILKGCVFVREVHGLSQRPHLYSLRGLSVVVTTNTNMGIVASNKKKGSRANILICLPLLYATKCEKFKHLDYYKVCLVVLSCSVHYNHSSLRTNAWICQSIDQSRTSCCLHLKVFLNIFLMTFMRLPMFVAGNKGDAPFVQLGVAPVLVLKPPSCSFVTISTTCQQVVRSYS